MMNSKYLSMMLLIAVPASLGAQSPMGDAESAHREIQLAHARELLGSNSSHLSSASTRKVEQVNQFVLAYVTKSLRGRWKRQSTRIAKAILAESQRYGFDPLLLLAVIQNESSFRPEIIGSQGEIGLMQLMPDSAAWIAQRMRIRFNGARSLHDPVTNIRIGAAYLSMLRSEFEYNKDLYLAAYNMGSGNVRRVLGNNLKPQIYAEKTIKHYSRIYLEFLSTKFKEKTPARNTYAAL